MCQEQVGPFQLRLGHMNVVNCYDIRSTSLELAVAADSVNDVFGANGTLIRGIVLCASAEGLSREAGSLSCLTNKRTHCSSKLSEAGWIKNRGSCCCCCSHLPKGGKRYTRVHVASR